MLNDLMIAPLAVVYDPHYFAPVVIIIFVTVTLKLVPEIIQMVKSRRKRKGKQE